MYIIKLDAIDSTNAYLKAMTNKTLPKDFTVVVSDEQKNGRGQMGTVWQSEKGKNLTSSIFKRISHLKIDQQFYISMLVSLALIKTLEKFQLPKLRVKWPNDILSADKKICGILIENVIKNTKLSGSIIGIGLNVNQRYFDNLPAASSMYLISGKLYDRDEVLSELLNGLNSQFQKLNQHSLPAIHKAYESMMFRINKPSTFETIKGQKFSGIIKGVTSQGKLRIWKEDNVIETYDFKEVSLLY